MKTASNSAQATSFDPRKLVETHQAGVWRYLRALGCTASEADDFTQDTFLAVLQRPFDDFNPSATGAYLRRVAFNLLVTARRRARKVTPVANLEDFEGAWEKWMGQHNGEETLEYLRQCLGRLTDRARRALELRFRERKRRAEIAASLNITEHGAKNLMQRAKSTLRSCVQSKLR
jgi:RNA polymerase sigma-70 factor (ECF subfamily)